MTGTKRNAGVTAVLSLLVFGALMLALAVALTGTVAPLQASVNSQATSSHTVSGSAEVLGSPASQGTLVRAWDVKGQVGESTVDASGNYSLSLPVNTSTVGRTITFTVGDQIADGAVQLAADGDDEVNLDAEGCGRALPRQDTTGTVEDFLVSACQLQADGRHYAKYYYFVLDRDAEITVSMSGEFSPWLILYSGVGRHGVRIASGGGEKSLEAGTYTIAASSGYHRETGRFTLTVTGLPRVAGEPTPTPPMTAPSHTVSGSAEVLGSPASQGTTVEAWSPLRKVGESTVDASGNYSLSLPVNTSTVGRTITFTVGDQIADGAVQLAADGDDEVNLDAEGCGRALPRQDTTGTVEDFLVSACQLQADGRHYAKYYYFVLDRDAEITVSMSGEFSPWLILYSGVGRHGVRIASGGGEKSLEAGTYTIAASSGYHRETGRFTLTVTGLPRVAGEPTPTPPMTAPSHTVSGSAEVLGSPASQGTTVEAWSPLRKVGESTVDASGNYSLSLPVNTSTVGRTITFTVGDQIADGAVQLAADGDDEVNLDAEGCGRALPRQDTTGTVEDFLVSACQLQADGRHYAKYYYFVLDRDAEITVSMSGEFSPWLILYSGVGRHGVRIASGGGEKSLEAGTYTIAASSGYHRETGRFTLTVTGLPEPTTTPLGAPSITTPITAGAGSLTVSWRAPSGDASGITAYDLRHILTSADEAVDANWTLVQDAWTGTGPLRYEITGLTGGAQYDLQVRAVNSVGDGPWSVTATGTPAVPAGASATRSFSATTVEPGGTLTVTITAANYGGFGGVTETLPAGFSYVSSTHGSVIHPVDGNSQMVTFTLFGETSSFTYTVTASDVVGPHAFSGTLTDSNQSGHTVGGDTTVTVGDAPPGVTVSHTGAAPVRIGTAIPVAATFTKTVTGFTVDDVTVRNGTVGNFQGSDAAYTFDVTPNAIGQVTVDIAANVAQDAGGNENTAAAQLRLGIPYDDNRNGRIERGEVIKAINDYLGAGSVERSHVIALINLYLSGQSAS